MTDRSERQTNASGQGCGYTAAENTVDETDKIANSLHVINSGSKSLEKMIKQIGGYNDNLHFREKIHNMQQQVNTLVAITTKDLRRLNVNVRKGDKSQKLRMERLTQAFQSSLAKYSYVQKELSRKLVANIPKKINIRNEITMIDEDTISNDREADIIPQQVQIHNIEFEICLLPEREAAIMAIEADVLDVSQIMKDLSNMVNEQAKAVEKVEHHIEAASADVEAGTDELAKAAEYQRMYRRKMVILTFSGLILAVILLIWVFN